MMADAAHVLDRPRGRREILAGVPDGAVPLALRMIAEELAATSKSPPLLLHIARDDRRLEAISEGMGFFAPKVRIIPFPAWDTVPYDRIGPNNDIMAKRITALARLAAASRKEPTLVIATVNAVLQRVPPRSFIRGALRIMAPGQRLDMADLIRRLNLAGFTRTGTVMEPGEYAVRGGIIDMFPPGRLNPVRLDFFGDTLEQIKAFDPETQRTGKIVQRMSLMPISEVAFGEAGEKLFRGRYVEQFGPATSEDALYEAVSAGQRYPGMEHWLPLFHDHLETLFDYLPDAPVSFDHLADEAVGERLALVRDHYQARREGLEAQTFGAAPNKPVQPDAMFVAEDEWKGQLGQRSVRLLTPFEQPAEAKDPVRSMGGRTGRTFAAERSAEGINLYSAVIAHVRGVQSQGKRVIIAAFTPGARERLATLFIEHGFTDARKVATDAEAEALRKSEAAFAVLGLEQGFDTPNLTVIGEQDILGDRLVRPRRKARRAADLITEATSLAVGDFVVHADHGIGRFDGLTTITALGAPHDCLEIGYASGDKLYLPVENIELLTRYGSGDVAAQLDRLGGAAWQSRKSRLKQRIREIASELIKIAALRQLREAPSMAPPEGTFDEFVARFPHEETEDQAAASRPSWTTSVPASRWIASCAVMSVSARRKWRCARPSSPPCPASRWPSSCPRRCSRASISPPSPNVSRACRCASRWPPASSMRRISRRSKPGSRKAPSISSSVPTRCSARTSPSRASVCSSSTRSSTSASPTRNA
jgi:transcription-repair coupling factor (superfamily II helicase)